MAMGETASSGAMAGSFRPSVSAVEKSTREFMSVYHRPLFIAEPGTESGRRAECCVMFEVTFVKPLT